jgi:hypothetical protein
MHDMVNDCVFVPVIATSGKVRRFKFERRVSGALERIGIHPLSELGGVRGSENGRVEVSMNKGGVVSQPGFRNELLDEGVHR